jgi:cyclopropane-fatty-acyl-phospholipid synthase
MKNKIFKYLEKAEYGNLEITTPENETIKIGSSSSKLNAKIKINSWSLIDLIVSKGDIGFGEAYIKKIYETEKIEDLLLFFALNYKILDPIFHGNNFYSIIFGIKNFFKKNSLKGSKKNIEYHYDLGNDFYSLWLDETMSYSAGIFCEKNCLFTSQSNKYQRILNQINQKGSRILEIGCGWGGFINEAHKKGYDVKGLTLSNQQKLYSEQLINNKNINSQIALQDYRHEKGKFDNIVSIEMFEAVGKKYWDDYFSKVKECLNKDGRAVIQTIVIGDDFYKKYLKTSDYIREYIFPGGFLPTPAIFNKLAKRHGLHVVDEFKFGDSYTKTLLKWLDNFNSVKSKVFNLGYSQEFVRKWQFYLAYCAAGFNSKRTDVIQYSIAHD